MKVQPREVDGRCPYCHYPWCIELTNVHGELKALRCLDCGEAFVVDVTVQVHAIVYPVAGVDSNAVMDRLIGRHLHEDPLAAECHVSEDVVEAIGNNRDTFDE